DYFCQVFGSSVVFF
nr:immunoglobulin light chain junction region [Macaca mulatta]